MNTESYYRFKLGDFECVCISDGGHNYPPQNFFANVPQEQVEEVLRQRNLPTDHIWTPSFPSLGHIVKKGEGWQWQSVEMEDSELELGH